MSHPTNHRLPVLLAMLVVVGLLAGGAANQVVTGLAYAVERGKLQATAEELAGVEQVSRAFRMVAKVAQAGVVHIRVRSVEPDALAELDGMIEQLEAQQAEIRQQLDDDPDNAELRSKWRELHEQLARSNQIRRDLLQRLSTSSGSGVIFRPNGYILTNNHVIDGGLEYEVRLHDGREMPATLVGVDSKSDLAMLKIDAEDLHALPFGDSDQMEVGDWVIAVGAPFGLSFSVTHGIISAKGRRAINTPIYYQDFLQTDAAINPGNSGGPLLNLRGEVIGINTAIATAGESYNAGVAFTIPSNMARRVGEELLTTGEVARGWLGILMADLTAADRRFLELPPNIGVLIDQIIDKSPASSGGLRVDDIITAIAGHAIEDMEDVKQQVGLRRPGEALPVKVLRGGEAVDLAVQLGRQPAMIRPRNFDYAEDDGPAAEVGLAVRMLLPSRAPALGFDPTDRGLLVVGVDDDSPLAGRVAPGELITAANGTPLASANDLKTALRPAGGRRNRVELVVKDGGSTRTVTVRPK